MKVMEMEAEQFEQLLERAFLSALQRAGMAPTPPAIDLSGNEKTDVQPQPVPEVKAEGGSPTTEQLTAMARSCIAKHGEGEITGVIKEFLVDSFGAENARIGAISDAGDREKLAKFLQALHHRGVSS